jgi:hypothetical protein
VKTQRKLVKLQKLKTDFENRFTNSKIEKLSKSESKMTKEPINLSKPKSKPIESTIGGTIRKGQKKISQGFSNDLSNPAADLSSDILNLKRNQQQLMRMVQNLIKEKDEVTVKLPETVKCEQVSPAACSTPAAAKKEQPKTNLVWVAKKN